jgi:hypothetical protein
MPTTQGVKVVSIDFTNVKDSGGPAGAHVPEGDYLLQVADVGVFENKNKDGSHVKWQLKIVKGAGKGTIYYRTSLKEDALWNLRNFLQDLRGKTIEKKALKIDFSKMVGLEIGATLADGEPYNNKVRSEIVATFPASDYKEDGADEEEAELEADEAELDEIDIDDE